MDKIKKFVRQFVDKHRFDFTDVHKLGRKYFLIHKQLLEMKGKINKDIYAAGLFLGEDRQEFKPSPALIEMIAEKSTRKAVINKNSEWLFLCGRDVFSTSVIASAVNDGLVLVQNEEDENLGYGKIIRKGNSLWIKNLLDRGSYLRQEQAKKK
ncbi:MAG: hypothetical protein V1743_00400 [Nanoarchaeota archaeon]